MAGRKTFLLGQTVIFSDGVLGRLEGLEMEPDWAPTKLVVRVPGRWPWQSGRLVRLPVSAAVEFGAELKLDVPSTGGEVIGHHGEGSPEGTLNWVDTTSRFQIAPGAVQRQAGTFAGLVVKADGSVHLIAEVGTLAKRRLLIPGEAASYQNHDFTWLDLKGESLDIFPTYEADEYVEREAWAALRRVPGLGETELRAIHLEIEDGKATLLGNVAASRIAEAMEEALTPVPSVVAVENSLIADPDVEVNVASALAESPATKGQRFVVRSRLGAVTLEGQVGAEAAKAAPEVARQVAGVVSVDSRLQPTATGKAGTTP
jgi:osmotically-inducible protein OsmY